MMPTSNFIILFLVFTLMLFRVVPLILSWRRNFSGLRQEKLSRYQRVIFHRFMPFLVETIIFEMIMTLLIYPMLLTPAANSTDDISQRVNEVSRNLAEASNELSYLQQALESRIEFVEDLKEQAEIAENVISLSEEQVNAIQAKLSQELEASNGKNTIITIIVSTFFFILGLIVPRLYDSIKRKKHF